MVAWIDLGKPLGKHTEVPPFRLRSPLLLADGTHLPQHQRDGVIDDAAPKEEVRCTEHLNPVPPRVETKVGLPALLPPEPQITGALGAALFAADRVAEGAGRR